MSGQIVPEFQFCAGTPGPCWYFWAVLESLGHAAAFSGFTISVMTHTNVKTHMDFNVRK